MKKAQRGVGPVGVGQTKVKAGQCRARVGKQKDQRGEHKHPQGVLVREKMFSAPVC